MLAVSATSGLSLGGLLSGSGPVALQHRSAAEFTRRRPLQGAFARSVASSECSLMRREVVSAVRKAGMRAPNRTSQESGVILERDESFRQDSHLKGLRLSSVREAPGASASA